MLYANTYETVSHFGMLAEVPNFSRSRAFAYDHTEAECRHLQPEAGLPGLSELCGAIFGLLQKGGKDMVMILEVWNRCNQAL